ncbi:MAG: heavy metal-associated domain-containing protein [Bacteroidales bacterium]|jgi:mercuric ion binding protein|nr:heavy metal-associated domain-containing protein [Bacteroidales bacterium]
MRIKFLISIIACMTFSYALKAQQTETTHKKIDTLIIQTNGHCESCKNKIEKGLAFEKGIKDVTYEISTAKVTVIYNTNKTTPENIRRFINTLGYDADHMKIDNSQQQKSECTKE